MTKPALVVLAAGMGSRFGGLKQIEPIGPSGEWILDYSVSDAIAAGFGKAIFIIRREMQDAFEPIRQRYAGRIETALAFQEMDDLPIAPPAGIERVKPWGTGHAVYAARHALGDAPFAVINADDFYGRDAYQSLSAFLNRRQSGTCALVAYRLANTLSLHGSVSRGICRSDDGRTLRTVEEHTEIARDSGRIYGVDTSGAKVELADDTLVSMNCWGFPDGFAQRLETLLAAFVAKSGSNPKAELYLPYAVDALVREGALTVEIADCDSRWLGVTNREDLDPVKEALAELVQAKVYASPLWG